MWFMQQIINILFYISMTFISVLDSFFDYYFKFLLVINVINAKRTTVSIKLSIEKEKQQYSIRQIKMQMNRLCKISFHAGKFLAACFQL